jgi:hypothetical protein
MSSYIAKAKKNSRTHDLREPFCTTFADLQIRNYNFINIHVNKLYFNIKSILYSNVTYVLFI